MRECNKNIVRQNYKKFEYSGGKSENYFRSIDFAVLGHSRDHYNFREFSGKFKKFR